MEIVMNMYKGLATRIFGEVFSLKENKSEYTRK